MHEIEKLLQKYVENDFYTDDSLNNDLESIIRLLKMLSYIYFFLLPTIRSEGYSDSHLLPFGQVWAFEERWRGPNSITIIPGQRAGPARHDTGPARHVA